jgi:hypothetical protein
MNQLRAGQGPYPKMGLQSAFNQAAMGFCDREKIGKRKKPAHPLRSLMNS